MLTQRPLAQTPGFSAHSFTSAGSGGCRHGICHALATLRVSSFPPGGWGPGLPMGRGGRLRLGNQGRAQTGLGGKRGDCGGPGGLLARGRGAHLPENHLGLGLPRGQRGTAPERRLDTERGREVRAWGHVQPPGCPCV